MAGAEPAEHEAFIEPAYPGAGYVATRGQAGAGGADALHASATRHFASILLRSCRRTGAGKFYGNIGERHCGGGNAVSCHAVTEPIAFSPAGRKCVDAGHRN